MAEPFQSRGRYQVLQRLAAALLGLALLAALAVALSGFGYRLGVWDLRTAFAVLRAGAWAGAGLAVISLATAIVLRPGRSGFTVVVAGLLVALVAAGVPWSWRRTARSVPRIHDISTDLEDPPEFRAVLPLRAEAPNPATHGGPEVAEAQRRGYPDLGPVFLEEAPADAFDRALAAVRDLGWTVVAADARAGRIEATDTTFWFGFRDDVVVRIRSAQQGSRVDVRSVSRVGLSDAGTNARRIRAFQERLR